MKRIIYIIAVLSMILVFAFPLSISAEEIDTEQPSDAIITEDVAANEEILSGEDVIEEIVLEAVEEEPEHNIFTRLYEAFCEYKTEVFTLGSGGILLILSIIIKKSLNGGLASVLAKSDLSRERQEAMIVGLNEMIDGYNEIKEQSAYVKAKIASFEAAVERVETTNNTVDTKLAEMFATLTELMVKEMRQNTELMEVLSTVYTNNEAIPQGIKDFVSLMRTENVKLVQEASELTAPTKEGTEGGEAV